MCLQFCTCVRYGVPLPLLWHLLEREGREAEQEVVNMVNTMDLGRGFLKLQEDNNSRRSSSLFRHKPLELNGT